MWRAGAVRLSLQRAMGAQSLPETSRPRDRRMRASLFALASHRTSIRTEVLAGVTTFLTMAYIVVVNPAILGEAGMPMAAVAAATCLAAGFGSILMGLLSNYPLALAPGMGLNAYFTYTVVKGMGVPWETALGCVFLSGAVFLVADPGRRAAADRRRHSPFAVCRRGRRHRPVHRLHRPEGRRHHRQQSGHLRRPRRPDRADRRPLPARPRA